MAVPQVALLRAVNVGGTGPLPMAELRTMGEACGLGKVRTHIASGNLLFESALDEAMVRALLETRLAAFADKPIDIFVRTLAELETIVAKNPFPDTPGNRHLVIFLNQPPEPGLIEQCRGNTGERLAPGSREIHVDYPAGIGKSRLTLPAAPIHTGRNFNTVRKIATLLAQ